MYIIIVKIHTIVQSTLPDYPARETKVKRRYNDFLWLYTRLEDEYRMTKNRKDPIPAPSKPPPKQALGKLKTH